jgi:PAS domain S-box-containing protein
MIDQNKSKQELIEELAEMRHQVASLEASLSEQWGEIDRLKQTELLWHSLAANTPVFLCLVDRAGTIKYLNRTVPGITMEDAIGKSTYEFLKPDYWEIAKGCIERVFDTGQTAFYEAASADLNGNSSWYETHVGPVKVGDHVVAVTLVANDITRRRQAEEERDRGRAILAAAVECLPFEFFAIGRDGRYMLENAVMRDHYGESIGKRPEDYAPDEHSRQLWLDNNRRAFAGERVEGEVEAHVKSETRTCYNIISPIRDGGEVCGILGVNVDITERKRAEESLKKAHDELEQRVKERTAELAKANENLRQSHDELQTIYDGIIEGLVITDVETKRFVRVNHSMCHMLGYSEEELLAASIKDIHPPEEVPNDLQGFQAAAEGRVSINENRPVLKKDGSIFYADITGHRVFYDERPCLLALFRDVTERTQAQEALRKEYRNLKHLLHASDHERQLIAYDIHDGLAQQLAAALMQLQAFDHLKDKTPKDAAKAYDAAMTMLQQGHFEARRLIAGVRPPILDESGVVEAVAHLVHELGRDKGPKIDYRSRVDFDRLDPTLENAIYRIAQEALTNACQHSKSERISVGLLQRADRLRIEIRDWGVGFDLKAVPKNHFGLEGIRQRVRLLGGKSSIRSKAGQGTRITADLPVTPRDEEG